MRTDTGIAENFIGILRSEERHSGRQMLTAVALFLVVGLLTAIVVDLPDGRFLGVGVGTITLLFVAGGALGLLYGRHVTTRAWRTSLTTRWNGWMRYSIACGRVDELHRRVRGLPATRSVGPIVALWTLILFVSLMVALLTVVDGGPTLAKTPLFGAYALWCGSLLGRALAVRKWVHDLLVSVDDLLHRGEIGIWGYL